MHDKCWDQNGKMSSAATNGHVGGETGCFFCASAALLAAAAYRIDEGVNQAHKKISLHYP